MVLDITTGVESESTDRILISILIQKILWAEVEKIVRVNIFYFNSRYFLTKAGMKSLSVESVSLPIVIPKTKFEAITPKDVRRDAF